MKKDKRLERIRELTHEELREEVVKTQEGLFRLRFSTVTEQNDNTSAIKEKQKDLARLKTVLRARELNLEKQAGN